MPKLSDFFTVEDERDVYLVTQGVKPAAYVTIKVNEQTAHLRTILFGTIKEKKLKQSSIPTCMQLLTQMGIPYQGELCKRDYVTYIAHIVPRCITVYEEYRMKVGKDRHSLDTLLNARGTEEFGLALGYPEDAVHAFCEIINGERRDGHYYFVQLARAKQAGIEIPNWLAYIAFIPAEIDFVDGNVSSSAETLGKQYQAVIRESNPDLATRIEKEFSEDISSRLPSAWTLQSNGSYECTWPTK